MTRSSLTRTRTTQTKQYGAWTNTVSVVFLALAASGAIALPIWGIVVFGVLALIKFTLTTTR